MNQWDHFLLACQLVDFFFTHYPSGQCIWAMITYCLVVVVLAHFSCFFSALLLTQGNMTRLLEATCTSKSYYRHVLRHTLELSNCNHSHSPPMMMMMVMSLVQPGGTTVWVLLHCRVDSTLHTGAWLNQDALRLSHYYSASLVLILMDSWCTLSPQ